MLSTGLHFASESTIRFAALGKFDAAPEPTRFRRPRRQPKPTSGLGDNCREPRPRWIWLIIDLPEGSSSPDR